MSDVTIGSAIALGILEGLTEFIPVSSTGHLILLGELLGVDGDKAKTFQIFIQLGALLAVVVLYYKRYLVLVPTFKSDSPISGPKGLVLFACACVPILIMGALFGSKIQAALFNSIFVASTLILGGVIMIIVERLNKQPSITSLEQLTNKKALIIGLFQMFSLLPGMSRSGSTIIGGLLSGLERKVAAEFSFLIAVPVMMCAVAYDLKKNIGLLTIDDAQVFAVGFVVAFFTALVAIKFFISLLSKITLAPFAYYRIALGILVLIVSR